MLPAKLLWWEVDGADQESPLLNSLVERMGMVGDAPLLWNRGLSMFGDAGGCKIRKQKILIVFMKKRRRKMGMAHPHGLEGTVPQAARIR